MISNFFINRPIVAMVIAILTVVVGFISMRGLPLAQFPYFLLSRPPQRLRSSALELSLAQTRRNELLALVQLYKALGGAGSNNKPTLFDTRSHSKNDDSQKRAISSKLEENVNYLPLIDLDITATLPVDLEVVE
jgi:hypothetical protein